MTESHWTETINDLLDAQIEAADWGGIIFQVSLSQSQVRVSIIANGQQEQRFFIYRHVDDATGALVMQRISNYLQLMKTWLGLKN